HQRVNDLIEAMGGLRNNERVRFARVTMEREGADFSTEAGRSKARALLYENMKRVLEEQAEFHKSLDKARKHLDPTEEFALRSTLYKQRGLSLDTSLAPNYALEVALAEMSKKSLLKGGIKRIAIVGPGLDFTDKQEGLDF